MVVNELYYGIPGLPSPSCAAGQCPVVSSPSPHFHAVSPHGSSSGISVSPDIIAAALHTIYSRDFDPQSDIEPNLFNAISSTLVNAVEEGAMSVIGKDPLMDALRHSTDVFSAFKVHRAQNDMAARLLDSDGNLKPFEQWREEVLPIADHQCTNWLETEYNTAVLRARQAANWQQFQREKDILPNLKWLPSTSPNPGADHRPFWNTILPVDHPFWDRHRPGDRWNCKCDLTSTDEPATSVPDSPVPDGSPSGNDPQPGLKDNPGKTQSVFSEDHPYFPADCKHCDFYNPTVKARLKNVFTARIKDCYHCPYIDGCIDRTAEMKRTLKERKKEARKAVQGKMLTNPNFPEKIMVSRASVDEWTNQPFMYMAEKHQMLLDIERVLGEAEYLGPADKHKEVDKLIQSHLFKTHVEDIDAYIIVWEFVNGVFILHSISDSPNILNFLKRK